MNLTEFLNTHITRIRGQHNPREIVINPPHLQYRRTSDLLEEHPDITIVSDMRPYADLDGGLNDRFSIRAGLHREELYWSEDLDTEQLHTYQVLRTDGLTRQQAHHVATEIH